MTKAISSVLIAQSIMLFGLLILGRWGGGTGRDRSPAGRDRDLPVRYASQFIKGCDLEQGPNIFSNKDVEGAPRPPER